MFFQFFETKKNFEFFFTGSINIRGVLQALWNVTFLNLSLFVQTVRIPGAAAAAM